MFAPDTYAARRRATAEIVSDGLIVVLGNAPAPMNYRANVYPFRQDGTFLYLTGLDEPGLALTLDAATGEATLYGSDPTMEDRVWEGDRPSMRDHAAGAGADAVAAPEKLADAIRAAQDAGQAVHVLPPYRGEQTLRLAELLGVPHEEVSPSEALIDAVVTQRLVKTDEEVAEIEVALEIAAEMHALAMRMAQPGRTEHEIAAQMEAVALAHGSFPSFPIILTVRGEVPHHHATGYALREGDLLLHDAGAVAPVSRYCADITRCSPVGGTFSERQRAIYQLVLDAQERCIAACAPGVSFRDVHDLASRTIASGLVELGLLRGDVDEIVAAGAHALFFHHGLGHAMGLDVHDMEGLGEERVGYAGEATRSEQFGTAYLRFARALQPGHVMTVEPGVYFNEALISQWRDEGRHASMVDYDEAMRWIGFGGVRIEDDIVITSAGHRVLGPAIPKQIKDVGAAVQAAA